MLRESDLHLPKKGWGPIVLAASASRVGMAWTDHGTARQERGPKHRAPHEGGFLCPAVCHLVPVGRCVAASTDV
jgi:hypothetical protein